MSWISVSGEYNLELERMCTNSVADKIEQGCFKLDDVKYLEAHRLPILALQLDTNDKSLELLRQLASSWDVQFSPPKISSHRKWIGPAIVGVKRLLFRVLAVLMREQVQKQRDFNAKAMELMIALHSK